MIIDFHIHMFPDNLAAKALGGITEGTGVGGCCTDGTYADTLAKMDQWGVDKAVVQHIATRPGNMHSVNDWAASIQNDRIYSFGSVHPEAEDALEEVRRIRALGLHGVKLHPDYQHFFAGDKAYYPLYREIEAAGLPVLFHTGFDPYSPDVLHTAPEDLAAISEACPNLTIIAAHMGGIRTTDRAIAALVDTPVYLDTAVSARVMTGEDYARVLEAFGPDRILFASDCPWSPADKELAFLKDAGLDQGAIDKILYKNACRLLGIEG